MILCYDLKNMINNSLHLRAKKKNKGMKNMKCLTSKQFPTCYTIIITAGGDDNKTTRIRLPSGSPPHRLLPRQPLQSPASSLAPSE